MWLGDNSHRRSLVICRKTAASLSKLFLTRSRSYLCPFLPPSPSSSSQRIVTPADRSSNMASPYNNGYVQDPVQRAPSPYNQGYTPDPNQSAPSPYTPSPYDQGQASSYYGQQPQTYDSNFTQNA
jgi:hypothetical protein